MADADAKQADVISAGNKELLQIVPGLLVGGRKKVISFFAGTAWLRSCRFLFHKFIQRDKAHKVIGNADVLPPLAAALVRGINVDRLDKFPKSVRGKLRKLKKAK